MHRPDRPQRLVRPVPPALAGAARGAVAHMFKTRARLYARRPQALDALYPGLGAASPSTLCAIAEHLVDREGRSPRRWFGFGGEVTLLDARAALLLGRALRRATRRDTASHDVTAHIDTTNTI